MNKLPAVLQKEIWEYVRGDQAYWKQQFNQIIQKMNTWKWIRVSQPTDTFSVRLYSGIDLYYVAIFDGDKFKRQICGCADREEALDEFRIASKAFPIKFKNALVHGGFLFSTNIINRIVEDFMDESWNRSKRKRS